MTAAERYDLAGLQVELLWMDRPVGDWHAPAVHADERGFGVVGVGTTRVAVDVGGRVAKVGHDLFGLAWNLQEASAWLTLPERLRQNLVPCVSLLPELVLVQERAEVISPEMEMAERIYDCRSKLGLWSDRDPKALRHDNFGLYDGRVVILDHGDSWPPVWPAWSWLLSRLEEDGPLDIEAERERFAAYLTGDDPGRDLPHRQMTTSLLSVCAGTDIDVAVLLPEPEDAERERFNTDCAVAA